MVPGSSPAETDTRPEFPGRQDPIRQRAPLDPNRQTIHNYSNPMTLRLIKTDLPRTLRAPPATIPRLQLLGVGSRVIGPTVHHRPPFPIPS
jgi:hypothetical protein